MLVFRLERVFGGWSEGRGVFLVHWPIVIMLMTRNNTHGHPSPRAPPGIAPAKSFICLSSSKSQSNPRSKGYCIPPFLRGNGGMRCPGIGDGQTLGLGGR